MSARFIFFCSFLLSFDPTRSTADCPAPDTPALTVGPSSVKGQALLHWSPVANAERYFLSVTDSAGKPIFGGGYAGAAGAGSYTSPVSPLPNTTIYCALIAQNNCGQGAGGVVTVSPVVPVRIPLDAPQVRGRKGNGSATLTWPAVPNADRYLVLQGASRNGPYTLITGPTADNCTRTTTFTAGGLAPHHAYYFVVIARNDAGTGYNSNTVRVVPSGPRKPRPSSQSLDPECPCNKATGVYAPDAAGPSAGDPVNLSTGVESYETAPDLSVYNPVGPGAYFQCSYSSDLAAEGGSTPGLSPGWRHNYDISIQDPNPSGSWNPLSLSMPDGGDDTLTPVLDGGGNPTGVLSPPAGSPYLVHGVPGSTPGYWQSLTVTWSDGAQWQFTPVADGYYSSVAYLLTRITDRVGRSLQLNWSSPPPAYAGSEDPGGDDGDGLTPLPGPVTITSGMTGSLLLSVVDAASGTALLVLSYDEYGDLASAADAYGRKVAYTFTNPDGFSTYVVTPLLTSISQVADKETANPPAHRSFAYISFSGEPLLSGITVPSPTGAGGATAHISYDADGKVTSLSDANSNQRTYTYSGGNTKVRVKNPAGAVIASWSHQLDADGHDLGETDAAGGSESIVYGDPTNPDQPTRITNKNLHVTSLAYDQYGNLLTATDPRNVTTTYSYDYSAFPLGRLMAVQEGSLSPIGFAYYEPTGLVQTVTAAKPGTVGGTDTVTTALTYDGLGNVLTIKVPGNNATLTGGVDQGVTTTFNYTSDPGDGPHGIPAFSQATAVGQPLTVTNNLGKTTHFRYNGRGLPLSVTDALGNETDLGDGTPSHAGGYNLADQLLLVSLPATGQTGSGRGTVVRSYLYTGGPLTGAVTNDEAGAQARHVSFAYGAEGETLSVAGGAEPVSYAYDALYRLKALADGLGQTTRYFYGPAGYLSSVVYPGNDTVQIPSYDAGGDPLVRLDGRGVETDYVYDDPESLLTAVEYPGSPGRNVRIGYDGFGRRASMTDGTGTQAYAYDDLDGLLSATTAYTGLPAAAISYGYFPDGSRQSMTTPAGTFHYTYDGAGRPNGVTNPSGETATQAYRDNGWLQSQTLGNGVVSSYGFNPRGLLTDLIHRAVGGTILSGFGGMTYDAVGNRTAMTVSVPGLPAYGGVTNFQYDPRDQLLQEQSTRMGGYTNLFGYDPAGNPTTFRGGMHSFNADNQHAENGFTYDKNGNPVSYKGLPLSFDPENRLVTNGH